MRVLNDEDKVIKDIDTETNRRMRDLANDTEGHFKQEDMVAISKAGEHAKRQAQYDFDMKEFVKWLKERGTKIGKLQGSFATGAVPMEAEDFIQVKVIILPDEWRALEQ